MNKLRIICAAIGAALLAAAVQAAVVGLIVLPLWNGLLPRLFAAPRVNAWQAIGLVLLARLFVGAAPSGGSK